jgi:cyclophilin family peptidyl-prolyl cis-trans isomerase
VSKRTRNRQLAKQHARRQAERQQHDRKRQRIGVIVAVLIIAAAGIGAAYFAFAGGEEPAPQATGPTRTEETGPTGATGQTTTVQPEPGPAEVACGGEQPRGALRPKPQFTAPEQVLEDGVTYTATLQTSCGDIVIELLAEDAPETVNSFVFLAQQGFFDGQRFHRLDTSIDVIQGGDPTGTGTGGPGYSIPDELTGDESYTPGAFAMANAGPDTGGSQFFIVTGPQAQALDDQAAWTIFGEIVEGQDVAETIQDVPIQDPSAGLQGQQPAQSVYIEKVTIDESR